MFLDKPPPSPQISESTTKEQAQNHIAKTIPPQTRSYSDTVLKMPKFPLLTFLLPTPTYTNTLTYTNTPLIPPLIFLLRSKFVFFVLAGNSVVYVVLYHSSYYNNIIIM